MKNRSRMQFKETHLFKILERTFGQFQKVLALFNGKFTQINFFPGLLFF